MSQDYIKEFPIRCTHIRNVIDPDHQLSTHDIIKVASATMSRPISELTKKALSKLLARGDDE